MRLRYLLLILFFCGPLFKAHGQDTFSLGGMVHKKNSPMQVEQVMVSNKRTKAIVFTDILGRFTVQARVGDTLVFQKLEYLGFQFVVTGPFNVNIYLQPVVVLNEVTIKEQSKKQEITDMMGMYKSSGGYYTLKPSVWSTLNSPITSLYELLGATPNQARKFEEHSKEELERIEIFKRYNKPLIKKVTGMTDDAEVQHFTDVFTPSYVDIKTWTDYEVVNYIKLSYAWYLKHKDDVKGPGRLY